AGRPRYSLVWKLVASVAAGAVTADGASPTIALPEWGTPTKFGSAS
ncbi:unnamed protein product, partial [Choristocarpus tenellus]